MFSLSKAIKDIWTIDAGDRAYFFTIQLISCIKLDSRAVSKDISCEERC